MASAQVLRIAREVLRNLFARERLGVTAADVPAAPRRTSLLKLLFAIEPLPLDPEPAPGRPRTGILRALLAPEALAEAPLEPPRPGRHAWLRWLFRPESLDPPPR